MNSHGRGVHEGMKHGWKNFGVVDTIFEDDDEDLDSLSSSPFSSPSSPLHVGVDAWTMATGKQPDVKIYVRGVCFHLHKDILISKTSYLKRHLVRVSEFTLCPPLNITVEAFKQVADLCYTNHITIMPSNVVSLRIASELLEMNSDGDRDKSLRKITESYLCNLLLDSKEFTCDIFRSSLALLPEAEQTACIASRCLEAMYEAEDDGDTGWADGLEMVSPEDFRVIMDSMQRRFTRCHDLLYRVADLYFQVYKGKTLLSDDQKTEICSSIDCSILSAPLVIHCVQNSRMPLRFVVQAMLIDQLNTHRSLFSVLNNATTSKHRPHPLESPATLGAILERDAALRQVAHMRAAFETTCSRIQTLEKELSCMKKLLGNQHNEKQGTLLLEDDRKTASCRFTSYTNTSNSNSNRNSNHQVERGERGSVSSSMLRLFGGTNINNADLRKHGMAESSPSLSSSFQRDDQQSPKSDMKRSFGQRLIKGLRTAFRVSSNKVKKGGQDRNKVIVGCDKEEIASHLH